MARHVCPWWVGYLLLSPLRRLSQAPESVVGPLVRAGDTVLDVGCAMGYFSVPMARMVGDGGRVIGVDLQPRMLRTLERRAARAGLSNRVQVRECAAGDLGISDLDGRIDFALLFSVVHEVEDVEAFLAQVHAALRDGGTALLAEPRGHVSSEDIAGEVSAAEYCGFGVDRWVEIERSRAVLLAKRVDGPQVESAAGDDAPGD